MKVTVTSSGDILLDVVNGDGPAAAEFIFAVQDEARKRMKKSMAKQDAERLAAKPKVKRVDPTHELTDKQREIVEFIANASSSGASKDEIMAGLKIPATQIYTRLHPLIKYGYVVKGADRMYKIAGNG